MQCVTRSPRRRRVECLLTTVDDFRGRHRHRPPQADGAALGRPRQPPGQRSERRGRSANTLGRPPLRRKSATPPRRRGPVGTRRRRKTSATTTRHEFATEQTVRWRSVGRRLKTSAKGKSDRRRKRPTWPRPADDGSRPRPRLAGAANHFRRDRSATRAAPCPGRGFIPRSRPSSGTSGCPPGPMAPAHRSGASRP